MSRLLMFACLTLGLIITGCGDDKGKTKGDKDQKTTEADKKGSAEKGSPTKDDKKADGKKADDKGSDAKKDEKKDARKDDKKASVDKKSDTFLVSVKLPT